MLQLKDDRMNNYYFQQDDDPEFDPKLDQFCTWQSLDDYQEYEHKNPSLLDSPEDFEDSSPDFF